MFPVQEKQLILCFVVVDVFASKYRLILRKNYAKLHRSVCKTDSCSVRLPFSTFDKLGHASLIVQKTCKIDFLRCIVDNNVTDTEKVGHYAATMGAVALDTFSC